MTTQTFAANTIMAYVGPDAGVVGVSGIQGFPFWEGDFVYFFQIGSGATAGIRKFDIDTDGDEVLQNSRPSIGVSWIVTSSGGAGALDYNGAALYFTSDPFNWSQLAKVNTSDLTLNATKGIAANFASEDGTHVLDPAMMTTRNNGSPNLMTMALSVNEHLTALDASFGTFSYLGGLAEANGTGILCSGGGFSGNTAVYAFGLPFANGSDGPNSGNNIGVYRVDSAFTRVGQFKASDLDATWTRITNFSGGAFDETDGNLICGAETDEAGPATKKYIFKVSASNGTIIWKCAVNFITPYMWGFLGSRIRHSKFHYLGLASLVYHINTATGAVTTETVTGLTVGGAQYSDDVTNSIVTFSSFTAGGSPPNYVGHVMGPPGNNHNLTAWMRFWFATALPPPGGSGRRLVAELGPVRT